MFGHGSNTMLHGSTDRWPAIIVAVTVLFILLAPRSVVQAQSSPVELTVTALDIGLKGTVRPGTWTPARIVLTNRTSDPRVVRCQWVFADADGDEVLAHRRITLNAERSEHLWLYAPIPAVMTRQTQWRFDVINVDDDRSLASVMLVPMDELTRIDPRERVVGVLGDMWFGLKAYEQEITQHEKCVVLEPLATARLPDRWYGLSVLEAMVWSPRSDSFDATDVREEVRNAVREWVQRGGHLVVILPKYGDTWFESSLAQILPDIRPPQIMEAKAPPAWLGPVLPPDVMIQMKRLEPKGDASVVLRDNDGEPIGVAGQYGFGRVTLVGVDLTDLQLLSWNLPSPICPTPQSPTLWRQVFGWRAPIFQNAYLREQQKRNAIGHPQLRDRMDIAANAVAPKTIWHATAASKLSLGIFCFIVYWLLAGPIGFEVLRRRGRSELAWVVFVGMVVAFTLICWLGALLIRPYEDKINHFTLVDVTVSAADEPGEALLHVHSWAALLVARHGQARVEVVDREGSERAANTRQTLGCVGLSAKAEGGGFLGTQRYDISAGAPREVLIPVRSTAKLLELDFVGYPESGNDGDEPWIWPNGVLRLEGDEGGGKRPSGQLVHDLPGPLIDVLFVYCPGEGGRPVCWRVDKWAPREPYAIAPTINGTELVKDPNANHYKDRDLRKEGWLGANMSFLKETGSLVSRNQMASAVELLSFFSLLPPPDFRDNSFAGLNQPSSFVRSLGREFDLSHLTSLRRLIVIGHLEANGPNPTPLRVDGRKLDANGLTVVRWICRL